MQSPGNVTVTKNSSAVVGSGTDFDCDDDLEGKYIKVIGNDVVYKILTVTDDTNIILDRAYRGETVVGAYYELIHNSQWKHQDLLDEEIADAGKFNL